MRKQEGLVDFFLIILFAASMDIFAILWIVIKQNIDNQVAYGLITQEYADQQMEYFQWIIIAYFGVLGLIIGLYMLSIVFQAVSCPRISFTLYDFDSVEFYEAVGILDHEPVLFSYRKDEKMFNNPAIKELYQKYKDPDNRDRRNAKGDADLLTPNVEFKSKRGGNESIKLIMNINESNIDYKYYPIEDFEQKELKDLISIEQFKFLKTKDLNGIISIKSLDKMKLELTVEELDELDKQYEKYRKKQLVIIENDLKNAQTSDEKEKLNQKMKNLDSFSFKEFIEERSRTFDEFTRDQVIWFKNQNIKTFDDFRKTDLKELEARFNNHFYKKKNIKGRLYFYPLEERIEELTEKIVDLENEMEYRLNKQGKYDWVDFGARNIKSQYPNCHAEWVYLDRKIPIATRINRDEKNKHPTDRLKKNDELAESKKYSMFLWLLPEKWSTTFNFERNKAFFKGHLMTIPQLTEASFISPCGLTNDIGVMVCVNCDHMIKRSLKSLVIDNEMLHDSMLIAYKHVCEKIAVKNDRMQDQIDYLESDIDEMARFKDHRFIEDLKKVSEDSFERFIFKSPKQVNLFYSVMITVIGISLLIVGLIAGFFLGFYQGLITFSNPPDEDIDITIQMLSLLVNWLI